MMRTEDVARVIQLVVAPVVMVSACAILLGGLLSRFGAINDRLRLLTRERLDLLRIGGGDADPYIHERLAEIDMQVPSLLRRLTLAQRAVFAAYGAILILVVSMFGIAGAVATGLAGLATVTLGAFFLGTVALFSGVLFILEEVRESRTAVRYEVLRVGQLRFFAAQGEVASSERRIVASEVDGKRATDS